MSVATQDWPKSLKKNYGQNCLQAVHANSLTPNWVNATPDTKSKANGIWLSRMSKRAKGVCVICNHSFGSRNMSIAFRIQPSWLTLGCFAQMNTRCLKRPKTSYGPRDASCTWSLTARQNSFRLICKSRWPTAWDTATKRGGAVWNCSCRTISDMPPRLEI